MAQATAIILDPHGNRSRDGRQWRARQRDCLRSLAPAEVVLVEGAQDAAQAARRCALQGFRRIVSVGDGRTANGVVNGLMELAESHRAQLRVGFLSLSRPDLWSRTLELPQGLARQLDVLAAGHTLPYDVGRVECRLPDGSATVRHFLNGASFGLTGRLTREWRDPHTTLLQALPAMTGALREAVALRGPRVRLECRGAVLYEGDCALALLMGGRYYPHFGRIAPQADPADGLLELAWLGGRPGWRTALRVAGLWLAPARLGAASLPWQSVEQVRAVTLDGPVHVEVDGQPIGQLPATFSVVQRTLRVMVEPVAVKLRKPAFKSVDKLRNGRLVGNIKSAAGL